MAPQHPPAVPRLWSNGNTPRTGENVVSPRVHSAISRSNSRARLDGGEQEVNLLREAVTRSPSFRTFRQQGSEKKNQSETIRVALHVRPLLEHELQEGCADALTVEPDATQVTVGLQLHQNTFAFDRIYGAVENAEPSSSLYETDVRPLIDGVFEGINATVFAYGITGAGKSYTMGTDLQHAQKAAAAAAATGAASFDSLPSGGQRATWMPIAQRAIDDVCARAAALKAQGTHVDIKCTFFEIYQDRIRDLLAATPSATAPAVTHGAPSPLSARADRRRTITIRDPDPRKEVILVGLEEVAVGRSEQLHQCLLDGLRARHTAATNMNVHSSRSHALLVIHVRQVKQVTRSAHDLLTSTQMMSSTGDFSAIAAMAAAGAAAASGGATSRMQSICGAAAGDAGTGLVQVDEVVESKLYLVDLAGSERVGRSGAEGERLNEACTINQALLALGNVIDALCDSRRSHVPYRDHILTRLLRHALGGNSKTLMVACVSPTDVDVNETLNTLRYASRARTIKNAPMVNARRGGGSAEQLAALRTENESLKGEVADLQQQLADMQALLGKHSHALLAGTDSAGCSSLTTPRSSTGDPWGPAPDVAHYLDEIDVLKGELEAERLRAAAAEEKAASLTVRLREALEDSANVAAQLDEVRRLAAEQLHDAAEVLAGGEGAGEDALDVLVAAELGVPLEALQAQVAAMAAQQAAAAEQQEAAMSELLGRQAELQAELQQLHHQQHAAAGGGDRDPQQAAGGSPRRRSNSSSMGQLLMHLPEDQTTSFMDTLRSDVMLMGEQGAGDREEEQGLEPSFAAMAPADSQQQRGEEAADGAAAAAGQLAGSPAATAAAAAALGISCHFGSRATSTSQTSDSQLTVSVLSQRPSAAHSTPSSRTPSAGQLTDGQMQRPPAAYQHPASPSSPHSLPPLSGSFTSQQRVPSFGSAFPAPPGTPGALLRQLSGGIPAPLGRQSSSASSGMASLAHQLASGSRARRDSSGVLAGAHSPYNGSPVVSASNAIQPEGPGSGSLGIGRSLSRVGSITTRVKTFDAILESVEVTNFSNPAPPGGGADGNEAEEQNAGVDFPTDLNDCNGPNDRSSYMQHQQQHPPLLGGWLLSHAPPGNQRSSVPSANPFAFCPSPARTPRPGPVSTTALPCSPATDTNSPGASYTYNAAAWSPGSDRIQRSITAQSSLVYHSPQIQPGQGGWAAAGAAGAAPMVKRFGSARMSESAALGSRMMTSPLLNSPLALATARAMQAGGGAANNGDRPSVRASSMRRLSSSWRVPSLRHSVSGQIFQASMAPTSMLQLGSASVSGRPPRSSVSMPMGAADGVASLVAALQCPGALKRAVRGLKRTWGQQVLERKRGAAEEARAKLLRLPGSVMLLQQKAQQHRHRAGGKDAAGGTSGGDPAATDAAGVPPEALLLAGPALAAELSGLGLHARLERWLRLKTQECELGVMIEAEREVRRHLADQLAEVKEELQQAAAEQAAAADFASAAGDAAEGGSVHGSAAGGSKQAAWRASLASRQEALTAQVEKQRDKIAGLMALQLACTEGVSQLQRMGSNKDSASMQTLAGEVLGVVLGPSGAGPEGPAAWERVAAALLFLLLMAIDLRRVQYELQSRVCALQDELSFKDALTAAYDTECSTTAARLATAQVQNDQLQLHTAKLEVLAAQRQEAVHMLVTARMAQAEAEEAVRRGEDEVAALQQQLQTQQVAPDSPSAKSGWRDRMRRLILRSGDKRSP